MRLHFDPATISVEDLLSMFWDGHDPTTSRGSQYRAGLYCDDEEQRIAAQQTARQVADELGRPVATEILIRKPFFAAEAYHQKWRLRQQPALFDALSRHYETEPAMLASTAAAKLNGYLGGHATDSLDREINRLGLNAEQQAQLRSRARR